MNISVQRLLSKMEEELKQAKVSTNEESLREKVYSIKILCELILDEKTKNEPQFINTPNISIEQPISLNQPKKMETNDEANGDSLFDF